MAGDLSGTMHHSGGSVWPAVRACKVPACDVLHAFVLMIPGVGKWFGNQSGEREPKPKALFPGANEQNQMD